MLHSTHIPRLSFANVVSVIALFIALGGGAYAVSSAGKNSVVSKSIKNGQVKTDDLADNAVTGAKVIDASLTGDDVDESTLGQVASAANAGHATDATNANHATSADTAAKADSATNANHATDADSATNATHATSADSATQATSANSARTADNGARAFDYDRAAGNAGPVSILTVGELTLRAECRNYPPTVVDLSVVSSTNADMNWGYLDEINYTGARPFTLSQKLYPGSPESLVQLSANAGSASTHRGEGQVVYQNANRIITITFHASSRYDSANAANNRCQARGTVLSAPL